MNTATQDTRASGVRASQSEERIRVVCIGETMLMFAPPPYETIEYCNHFIAFHGGAESNIAIGLERLGIHTGWIGKLPCNALGRKIVNELRSFGVDTSAVVWAEQGRVGTFFVEWGAPPRPLKTIYDRAGSAATTLTFEDLRWDYIARAEWIALTGITPALSETCYRTVLAVAHRAREAGIKVIFDVNYRALLWPVGKARAALEEILPFVNLLIMTEEDAVRLFGAQVQREEALQALLRHFSLDAVVMTLGGEGSIAYDGRAFYRAPGHVVQVVNRLGAGDAFVAGLLYGYIHFGLQEGLHYGSAMSALKLTIPQNIPLVNKEDVERLVKGESTSVIR
jgi:2-dehydro-3-deoxygluconokinase